jgi:hypothetical protein
VPYLWAGSDPEDGFDCSGLIMWAYAGAGKSLPHSSQLMANVTRHINFTDLQPGDLLFYGAPIHHVGMYVGNGQMIEAPNAGADVRYASIWRSDLVLAGRRVIAGREPLPWRLLVLFAGRHGHRVTITAGRPVGQPGLDRWADPHGPGRTGAALLAGTSRTIRSRRSVSTTARCSTPSPVALGTSMWRPRASTDPGTGCSTRCCPGCRGPRTGRRRRPLLWTMFGVGVAGIFVAWRRALSSTLRARRTSGALRHPARHLHVVAHHHGGCPRRRVMLTALVLSLRNHTVLAAVAGVATVLTKEPMFLGLVGLALWRRDRRGWRSCSRRRWWPAPGSSGCGRCRDRHR